MKVGMMPVWDKWGTRYGCTVLQLDDCKVIQVKTTETDGYNAVQLGVGEMKERRVGGLMRGHMNKWVPNETKVPRKLSEFRVTPDCLLEPGTKIPALHFVPGQLVDVKGITKGKGFQGVMKRWNFRGGDATHGNSLNHRTMGSTGMCQDPGRVFKNKKMPGRMGGGNATTQNLFVVRVDTDRNLIYVNGPVPGQNGGFVRVVDAVKGPFHPSPPPVPTYLSAPEARVIMAPVPDTDPHIDREPIDPY